MLLELIDETRQFPEPKKLSTALQRYLQSLGIEQTVTLVLVDDKTIRELNKRDRNIDKATDVLSYPLHEPDDIDMPLVEQLGDIFISLDTAHKQAETKNHNLIDEVLILAAHGITHLRGLDHDSPAKLQVFRAEEAKVLDYKNA